MMRDRYRVRFSWLLAAVLLLLLTTASRAQQDVAPPVTERFADEHVEEVPDFQRHVVPLLGRLGCNSRSCHGSFQGRGGFQLSLFGYDFAADHAALRSADSSRVQLAAPLESLMLRKPTMQVEHEGGQRYDVGSWQYHLLRRWIEGGATFEPDQIKRLVQLEVTPSEIVFAAKGDRQTLSAIAIWEDGSHEDVTPLCRFQANDAQIAEVDEHGVVTGGDAGDSHVIVFYDKAVVPVPVLRPVSSMVNENYPEVAAPTQVDELVLRKLRKLGIQPSDLCSDTEFLRRVRLDLTGTLPTPDEITAFLADDAADKRSKKIDQLLTTPEYAAWWTTLLCDFTGNNDDQTVNVTPARGQAGRHWYDWIYRRVADNVPYDELAEGIVLAKSRNDGESYYEYCESMSEISRPGSAVTMADRQYMPYFWARRDFRRPPERAISFAYAFLGVRIECAQCHKHPFDQWSKQDFEDFSKFFAGVQAVNRSGPGGNQDFVKLLKELGIEGRALNNQVRNQLNTALRDGKVVPFPEVFVAARGGPRARGGNRSPRAGKAVLLGGETTNLGEYRDPREPLMEWLRSESNPYFARAFVNRVWAAYFGVGIVDPPDDHSLANPPSNRELLDHLASGFIRSGFDMHWVHREILNSDAYQRSWRPNETNQSDQRNFSRAQLRRLPAEVVYDAIQQATVASSLLNSGQSNVSQRAIATPGAGTRGNRNREAGYALAVFGRSTRESNCDCDRSAAPSLLQTIFLQNDPNLLALINRRDTGWVDEVRRQLQATNSPSSGDNPRRDPQQVRRQLERRITQVERLVRRLREQQETERLPRLETQLTRMKVRLARLESLPVPAAPAVASEQPPQSAAVQVDDLIQQAYLRTLSRRPEAEELRRSRRHLDEAEDTVSGLRDLMWALLNTKEFIVNH